MTEHFCPKIDFSTRYPNYKPLALTMADERILNLLDKDIHTYKHLLNHIENKACVSRLANPNILVVGSGSGGLPIYLREHLPNANITSLDISFESLKRIRLKSESKVSRNLVCADAENIPLENESYDVVVAHGVFRYIKNKNRAAKEINRVLRSDGMAFLSEGKDIATMGDSFSKLSFLLVPKHIYPEPFLIENVQMPRLTLFYALWENRETDDDIANQLMAIKATNPEVKDEEILFNMAGTSISQIYGISWTKNKI